MERAVALAREALPLLPTTELMHPPTLFRAASEFLISGCAGPATELTVAALAVPDYTHGRSELSMRKIALLARLHVMQGRLRQAAATYARAAWLVPGQSPADVPIGGLAYHFGLGALLTERNDLEAAERLLAKGTDAVGHTALVRPGDMLAGYTALARVRQARGDGPGALAAMAEFMEVARLRRFVPAVLAEAAAQVARLRLRQGDLAEAARWAEESGLQSGAGPRYAEEAEYLTLARVQIAHGRAAELSAIAVLVTPAYLLFHHLMHIVAFEPLLWAGCSYFAVRAIKYDAAENWLYAGVLAGLGLENKYTIAVLLFGLLLGLLATQARKSLLTWQLWGGVGLALLLFAPNLIWETVHHFPLLEWQKYIRAHPEVQTFNFSAAGFFGNQVLYTLPVFALWIAGLWFFLFSAKGRQFRFLGIAALAVIGFGLSSGKSHYAIPIYAILYTGGAIAVETLTERANRRWLRRILIEVVVVAGIILAPCFLPILPVDVFAFYQRFLHLPLPIRSESYEYGSELPSQLAWELNWDELVTAVARVYNSLPDDEKSKAGIMTQTYGEAGAIDLLGKKYGLPKAISGQLSYYDFGTRNYTGEVLITVGMDPRMVAQKCRSVTSGAYIDKSYGYTTEVILVCKGFPLQDWPAFKHY